MNTVPGMTTRFKFTPDTSTEDYRKYKKNPNFNYVLMCNKICGGAHYKMNMIVVVKEKAAYNAWMASKKQETFKAKYFPAPAAAPVATAMVGDTTMKN